MTVFTWDAPEAGSTTDWTTPANWDQNSSYPGNTGDEDAIVIIPSGMERCNVNAAVTIGNLTVSGNHNDAAAGNWDVRQQAKLTVTGNMFLHSGTWDCDNNDLDVGTNYGQVSIKDGHLLAGAGTHRWGSGLQGNIFALDLSNENGTGVLTSAAGVWYVGSIRCNRAGYELNLPSEVCYVNGHMTSWDRKFELTNGKILHNKGALHIYGPDDIEPVNPGQTPLTDTNAAIQWDAPTVAAQDGNQGPYDLIIDVPYDNRPNPIGAQHTINIRNKLIVEHYFYPYKGKFTNYSADVGAAKDFIVSGMTLFGCSTDGLVNSSQALWQGRPGFASSPYSGSRTYNKWSRGYLLLTGASATIHLGSGTKGNLYEWDKKRDGTSNPNYQAVTMWAAAVLDLGDSNPIIGNMRVNYQTTDGGVGGGDVTTYPYVKLSSNNTTYNSKGYNSYAMWNVNVGSNLGNRSNAFLSNSGNCGIYHNNGLLTMNCPDSASILSINQNGYIQVSYAGDPAYEANLDGYGRRVQLYNFTVTGHTMQMQAYGYIGAPIAVANDFTIAESATVEFRDNTLNAGRTNITQPYAGGIVVSGATHITGTLDLSIMSTSIWQEMLISSSAYSNASYAGAWPQFEFEDMTIDINGTYIAPGTGDTIAYSTQEPAITKYTGYLRYVDPGSVTSFVHNSGTVLFNPTVHTASKIGIPTDTTGLYNVNVSTSTSNLAVGLAGNPYIGILNNLAIQSMAGTGNVYFDRKMTIGGNFSIDNAQGRIDAAGNFIDVSGNFSMSGVGTMGGKRSDNSHPFWTGYNNIGLRCQNFSLATGSSFYLPSDGVWIKGNFVNEGGTVTQ